MKALLVRLFEKLKRRHGQSVVEAALVLPLLILLLCGILDFGWIYMNQYKVDYASYSGARYGSITLQKTLDEDNSRAIADQAFSNLFGYREGQSLNVTQVAGDKEYRVTAQLKDGSTAVCRVCLDAQERRVSVSVESDVTILTFVAGTAFHGKTYRADSVSVASVFAD